MRPIIVLNDPTSAGGRVIAGAPSTFLHNLNVARLGDAVLCPHGLCKIVSGDSSLLIDDRPVARQGDLLACGATLLATYTDVMIG
ncbi:MULTISPECIES: PAAR domain-containing protein [unclassified Pseudomonas]|uniref:PAAR domain-containing protein n=1 Tax=unclassified Pseudomonas TaxID=196821 RepID=UPI000D38E3FB|nr:MULTISPECIES: PAAR domain-containing protein [unclassified Pseudomonas]RAU43112.1 PAAR domain-containing protein [Pseudomonas sp. RIT 409]RAU53402.1 PAAR domain-containing protein [Pseudomonas sp. RIT 412]